MKIYVQKVTRNSFLGFYCSYLVFVTTGIITSTLTSFYFSEWYHRLPSSQTRNAELLLDTFLFLPTPSPTVSSLPGPVISHICLLLSTSHHLPSFHRHLLPALLQLPPDWSSYSSSGPLSIAGGILF